VVGLRGTKRFTEVVTPLLCTAGASAVPSLFTGTGMASGSRLLFFPDTTKTGARDGPMEAVTSGGQLCCVTWLRMLLESSKLGGCEITNYVTRPLVGKKVPHCCIGPAVRIIHDLNRMR